MIHWVRKVAGIPLSRKARFLARQFLALTENTAEVQRTRLRGLLSRNAASQFGKEHDFHRIRDFDDYRNRLPIRDYDGFEPYLRKVREGDIQALFGPDTKVHMFARTSGTTAHPKAIPVTDETLQNYRDGWSIWGILAFDDYPDMMRRGLKPILQFAGDWRESFTPSGIPCGAITGLTAHMQSPVVRLNYCMTPAAGRIKDIASKYYAALRLSIYRDIGTIIAANPSTILAMARLGDQEKSALIRDVADGAVDPKWNIPPDIRDALRIRTRWKRRRAARRLEAVVNATGRLLPKDYWPGLQFLANWTGGTMGAYLRDYPEWFGDKPVRDVGLIASECRMTIPVASNTASGILDIRHHVFEFLPEADIGALAVSGTALDAKDAPRTLLAHELKEGERYFILLTTAGGLYRYHIHDLVRCTGFYGTAPLIEFLNKGAHVSSITGEKLSEYQVVRAVDDTLTSLGKTWSNYLVLPLWGNPPRYVLHVEAADLCTDGRDPTEAELCGLTQAIEHRLSRLNEEYENRLQTRRLAPMEVRPLPSGTWTRYQRYRLDLRGGTMEQYKKPCLLPDLEAIRWFDAPVS